MVGLGREVRLACLLAVLLPLLSVSAHAVLVDLGSYSVQDPRITVNYTEEVFLLSATLVNLEPDAEIREYTLRQEPPKDPESPTYIKSYRLYTGTVADPQYLQSGSYQMTLESIGRQGSSMLDIVSFAITGLDIELVSPRFGFSPTAPFDVTFTTSIDGEPTPTSCWYSKVGWASGVTRIEQPQEYEESHSIGGLSYNGYLYISCTESGGRETRKRFSIGRDQTAPLINVSAIPPVVSDPRDKSTIIRVLTDDNASCAFETQPFPQEDPGRASTYRRVHELRRYYNDITDTAQHDFFHEISCVNLAGLDTTAIVPVTVNFGAFVGINVLEPSTGYVNASSFRLRVRPTFDASSCQVNRQPMQAGQDEEWSSPYSNVQEGKIALNITCAGSGKNATLQHVVTIDTTPPKVDRVTPLVTACDARVPYATAEWNASDTVSGIASFVYSVTQDGVALANGTSLPARARAHLPEDTIGDIRWSVAAFDLAGNLGVAATADASCDEDTTVPPPRNTTNQTVDGGGACTFDTDCLYGEQCVFDICRPRGNAPGPLCSNGARDAGEEDVDCGGDCLACVICFDDADCTIDEVCGVNSICVPPTDIKTSPPGPSGGCVVDGDCLMGEICSFGSCRSQPSPTPTPPPPEKTDWLAIILVIAGLLIMGGAGWFLYQHDNEKNGYSLPRPPSGASAYRPSAPSAQLPSAPPTQYPRPPSGQTPPSPTRPENLPRTGAQPIPDWLRAEKEAQRKRVLRSFDSSTPATRPSAQPEKQAAVGKGAVGTSASSASGKKRPDDDEDVFSDLERLGKKK